ncbi:hypothetical protein MC885_013085 [Smutsia gigantea]|nr:hypothetical protein MC885_013085 [Smutsia gigantea]
MRAILGSYDSELSPAEYSPQLTRRVREAEDMVQKMHAHSSEMEGFWPQLRAPGIFRWALEETGPAETSLPDYQGSDLLLPALVLSSRGYAACPVGPWNVGLPGFRGHQSTGAMGLHVAKAQLSQALEELGGHKQRADALEMELAVLKSQSGSAEQSFLFSREEVSALRLKIEELEQERSRLEEDKKALEMQLERLTLQVRAAARRVSVAAGRRECPTSLSPSVATGPHPLLCVVAMRHGPVLSVISLYRVHSPCPW